MKKTIYLFAAALAMVSCGNSYKAKDVVLGDMQDSVNFALGYVNGAMLKMQQLQEDSSDAVIAEFIDALQRGYDGKVEELSESASVGKNIGMAIKSFEKNGLAENKSWQLNEKVLLQGMVNGMNGDTTVMDSESAKQFFQAQYQASMMANDSVEAGKAIRAQCPDKVKALELKSFTDSINYAFGLMNGNEIKMYVLASDSTGEEQKEFIKQVNKALKMKVLNPQMMNIGEQIGKTIKEQEATGLVGEPKLETRFPFIKQGFINGMKGHDTQFDQKTAGEYVNNTITFVKYGDTKGEGERFLEANKLKDGVQVTESGLQYEVLTMGKGPKPEATDRVKVHYHGTLIDGTVFDSSVDRGEPATFGLNGVIAGWTEGLQLMPVGSKFRFYIPQELGYGSRATGSIPPYSTLIFDVELLSIEKGENAEKKVMPLNEREIIRK